MRAVILLVALVGGSFAGGLVVSAAQKTSAKEKPATLEIRNQYDLEIAEAKKVYQESVSKAQKRLLDAYDLAINAAIKKGGGDGLEMANELSVERKKIKTSLAKSSTDPANTPYSPSRDEIVKLLTGTTWNFHWEQPNSLVPHTYSPDGTVVHRGQSGEIKENWTLELKWVINQNGHFIIPIDDRTLRGFFIRDGRQFGAIADRKKDNPDASKDDSQKKKSSKKG